MICPFTGKPKKRRITLLTLRGHQMDLTVSDEYKINVLEMWNYILSGWKAENGLSVTLLNDIPVGVLADRRL